jgi:demethylmenaquinone methyltransferase/2-methoxy-6-polyprenyl-1,4-benzoquinol methylase
VSPSIPPTRAQSCVGDAAPLRPHPPLDRYYESEPERRRRLTEWFDASAPAYDWISQVLSFGSNRRYRRRALERAGLVAGMRALDVACGTGISTKPVRSIVGKGAPVVGLDPSFGMLEKGMGREGILLVRSVAESLPFAGGSFDFLAMGYALRHVSDLRPTFREFHRVLRPGGVLLILEITPPASRIGGYFLRLYLRRLIPLTMRLGRGGKVGQELMEYFWETIEACVPPATIMSALAEAGFADCDRYLELGIFSEYRAIA